MVKTVKLFVEGGGNSNALRTECRAAFNAFLRNSGLDGHMPRIVACGSRQEAYSDYCTAAAHGENAILLVDSESPVIVSQDAIDDLNTWKPWYHLKNRQGSDGQLADNWDKPNNVSENDCHLMVELMESWFLADIQALKEYYGQGFIENCFTMSADIESIPKAKVIKILEHATRNTAKGTYRKGQHSFELLKRLDAEKVITQSRWAKRFVTLLSNKMQTMH